MSLLSDSKALRRKLVEKAFNQEDSRVDRRTRKYKQVKSRLDKTASILSKTEEGRALLKEAFWGAVAKGAYAGLNLATKGAKAAKAVHDFAPGATKVVGGIAGGVGLSLAADAASTKGLPQQNYNNFSPNPYNQGMMQDQNMSYGGSAQYGYN